METIPYHPLLEVKPEEVRIVRGFFNLDDINKIKESVEAIDDWCKKQPHLVEGFQYLNGGNFNMRNMIPTTTSALDTYDDDIKALGREIFNSGVSVPTLPIGVKTSRANAQNILERLLILSRGSVEGTKVKLDKFMTMRGMTPELNLNKSVNEFKSFMDCVSYVPLPKLCPTDQSRVMVTQVLNGKWDDFNLLSYLRYCFLIGEYRLHYDYCLSERFILDLNNVSLNLLTKLNPIILKKAEILCTEGFGTKIKGIHILNAPSFVDRIVFLIKQGLKEKVAARLHVHNTFEELHKEIPKEILPEDYGGDGPSCAKLTEQWKDILNTEESRKIIENCNKLVSDESKRSSVKFNEDYLGMPGSFRKLNVD